MHAGVHGRQRTIYMRILIAEDDSATRMLLERQLKFFQHETVVTQDGTQAWEALQKPDAPRIAILDWNMPGLTGVQVCQELRAPKAALPIYVIMLTSHAEREDIVVALQAGANDYITKPYHIGELQARIAVGVRTVELQEALAAKVHELEEAAKREIRMHELMPICAWCRKIRNDDNYWQTLEAFLSETGVKFTHGICAECYAKVSPAFKK